MPVRKTYNPRDCRRTINASTSITSQARNRQLRNMPNHSIMASLNPQQRSFANQLALNCRKSSRITAATNTTNIMARPDFMDLLPMFVQKLLITDVFGSVAMKSRQQLIPYFKFVAENTKGQTNAGDVLSSPFANRQGADPHFTTRVVKNELVAEGTQLANEIALAYTPVMPGTITLKYNDSTTDHIITDDGAGNLTEVGETSAMGYIDYSTGLISATAGKLTATDGNTLKATYQYDNENVGPRTPDNGKYGYEYGAQMAKGYLQLDEINLVAEAMEIASYWSIYSAFAAQTEYGANLADISKEAAISELTAEVNERGFQILRQAASYRPQFNWDASPVLAGSVVPSDYLNMFKLKLNQASSSVYQATRLARPNRLVVGSNVASYIQMINGFNDQTTEDNVGPYKLGQLDQFEIYVDPNYSPDEWVMCSKSNDIRRNSALFGEYAPLTTTDPIGLANASVQQGAWNMCAMKVINPATVVSGKILGVF